MPAGGQPDDSQLLDACASLGIEVYHPPKAPIREAKVTADGSACLVFSSETSRRKHITACRSEVQERCLSGARAGCSVNAMDKCRGHPVLRWFRQWTGGQTNWAEVERCEEEYMQACLQAADKQCAGHAQSFCGEAMRGIVCVNPNERGNVKK